MALIERMDDYKFMQAIYTAMIQVFEVRPMMTLQQFFSVGYSDTKVDLMLKIIDTIQSYQNRTI